MSLYPSLDSPRPPTPPKKNTDNIINDALQFLGTAYDLPGQASLATPPPSSPPPPLRIGKEQSCYYHPAKRIRFDTQPTLCADATSDELAGEEKDLKEVPRSRLCKSPKSILKPVHGNIQSCSPNADHGRQSPRQPPSFLDMLEHSVKQLASSNIAHQIDGYHILINEFRACKQGPERDAIIMKLPLLEDFIRRDLTAGKSEREAASRTRAVQALKLCSILFMERYQLTPHITIEFQRWIFEDTVKLLSTTSPSKEIVKNQLYLMVMPGVYNKLLASEATLGIVQSLCSIHLRVSGTSIQSLRLMVLLKLVDLQQASMLSSIRLWLPAMIHGLFSNSKDIRRHAITLGQRAADVLGTSRTASQSLIDFLDLTFHKSHTNYDLLKRRLSRLLISEGDDALEVPRIWAIVVTFLRGSREHLEFWKRLLDWLRFLQPCFNTINFNLNVKSLVAWNHFIVALRPGRHTKHDFRRNLCRPIFAILERRGGGEAMERIRDAAASSYCLVLFHALQPNAADGQWLTAWKEYVDEAIRVIPRTNMAWTRHIYATLTYLLYESKSRVWNAKLIRIKDNCPIQPDDLPRLSPQWIRNNLKVSIMPSILHLIKSTVISDQNDRLSTTATGLWRSVISAVIEASNREVKASPEKIGAVQSILDGLTSLAEMLNANELDMSSTPPPRLTQFIWSLVQTAVELLGAKPFLEHLPVSSSIRSTNHKPRENANFFVWIFRLISRSLAGAVDESMKFEIEPTIRDCLKSKKSRKSKVDFLSGCFEEVTGACNSPAISQPLLDLHKAFVQLLTSEMKTMRLDQTIDEDVYELIVSVGCRGLQNQCADYLNQNKNLLEAAMSNAKEEKGDGTSLIKIVLPLLDSLANSEMAKNLHGMAIGLNLILLDFTSSQSSLSLAKARNQNHSTNALWAEKTSSALGIFLQQVHLTCESPSILLMFDVLDHFHSATQRFDTHISSTFLDTLPAYFAPWVTNVQKKPMNDDLVKHLLQLHIWLLNLITSRDQSLAVQLAQNEDYICAGFQSFSAAIANASVMHWNSTFGKEQDIEYPTKLREVLIPLSNVADIDLAGLDPKEGQLGTYPNFNGFEDIIATFPWMSDESKISSTRMIKLPGLQLSRPNNVTPRAEQRRQPPKTPSRPYVPQRLRHDDSQIEFVPISSSPPEDLPDSQLLTEHQKEIRERQHEDIVFPELRSSSPLGSKNIRTARSLSALPRDEASISRSGQVCVEQTPKHEETVNNDPPPSSPPSTPPIRDQELLGKDIVYCDTPSPTSFKQTTLNKDEHTCQETENRLSSPERAENTAPDHAQTRNNDESGNADEQCNVAMRSDQNPSIRDPHPDHPCGIGQLIKDIPMQPTHDTSDDAVHAPCISKGLDGGANEDAQAADESEAPLDNLESRSQLQGSPMQSRTQETSLLDFNGSKQDTTLLLNEHAPNLASSPSHVDRSEPMSSQVSEEDAASDAPSTCVNDYVPSANSSASGGHLENTKPLAIDSPGSRVKESREYAISRDVIRPLSRSPSRTHTAVVRVPQTSVSLGDDNDQHDNNTPASASSQRLASVSPSNDTRKSKRKRVSKPTASSQRTRILDTMEQVLPTSNSKQIDKPSNRNDGEPSRTETIVLKPLNPGRPSLLQQVRERRRQASASRSRSRSKSQSQSKSPTPLRRKNRQDRSSRVVKQKTPTNHSSPLTRSVAVAEENKTKQRSGAQAGTTTKRRGRPPGSLKRNKPTPEAVHQGDEPAFSTRSKRRKTTSSPSPAAVNVSESPSGRQPKTPKRTRNSTARTTTPPTTNGSLLDTSNESSPAAANLMRSPSPPPKTHAPDPTTSEPARAFTFTPPTATPQRQHQDSQSQLSPRSMEALAHSVKTTLKDLFQDVKRLFLGVPEARQEREELEDAYYALGEEVRAAGRR